MTRSRHTRPPVFATWLIHMFTPRVDRDCATGDLQEEFQRKLLGGTPLTEARRWFWRQAVGSVGPNIRRRLSVGHSPSTPPKKKRYMFSSLVQDARHAIRSLGKQPTYSLTVIGLLTLGIAGTTAVFCVFNGLFLRPLPFAEPERLVNFDETAPRWDLEFVGMNYVDFVNWQENNSTFEAMAVFDQQEVNLTTDDEPVRVSGARVTHEIAAVLGIRPLLGRFFSEQEDLPDAERVAMLGFGLWQGRYGADPGIIGRSITLEGIPFTVVGVLPREAEFIAEAELWIPLAQDLEERSGSWWLNGIGRLKSGVTIEQATEDLTRIHKNAIEERSVNEITSPVILPVLERILGDFRLGTLAMLGAVGLVLVIACINIAGITLARSLTRGREVAIRLALGAGRGRVIQQHLTESLVLSVVGALLGTALGLGATSALRAMAVEGPPAWVQFGFDVRVLGFVLVLTVGAAIAFGLLPAWSAANSNASATLQATATRISTTLARRRALDLLVVGEIALSVVLLVAAGLAVRDFQGLRNVNPGFSPENVLMYEISLPDVAYDNRESQLAFFETHLERIRALPGVTSAAIIDVPPLQGHNGYFFEIEDAPPEDPDAPRPVTSVRVASSDYIETMEITLLSGRTFLPEDGRDEGTGVVIVNETFARRYWPDEDPVGKRIRAGSESTWETVVGVTRDVKHYGLDTEMRQGVYWPFPQAVRTSSAIVLRTAIPPQSLVAPARQVLQDMDPSIPMANVATMLAELEESLWVRKGASRLSAAFSLVALLLAVGGIYGVVSYRVNQRTKEIGIQMALGARPNQVLAQVLRHGALVIGTGIVLGLAGAYGAGKLLASVLVDANSRDPLVYGVVVVLLVAATVLANLLPARRAASVQPAEVLRGE
jgi:predicted permease